MNDLRQTIRAKTDPPPFALATIAAPIVAFALARGMTLAEVEAAAGVTAQDLADPNARLKDNVPPLLWRALMDAFPGEALAIEMARAAPLSSLGGLLHGAQFAATVGEALRFIAEHSPYVADRIEVAFLHAGNETVFTAWHPNDPVDRGRTSELGIGLVWRAIAEALGADVALVRVEFAHLPFGPEAVYEAFFQAPVHFGRARCAMVFETPAMEASVRHANAPLFAFMREHYGGLIAQMRRAGAENALTPLRAAILANAEQGAFSAQAAAARAGLSLRSAQRLALRHETTLQAMIDDVRSEIALALMKDVAADIQAVALAVGYSDDRAFRRAFKRWTGQTPSQHRRGPNGAATS